MSHRTVAVANGSVLWYYYLCVAHQNVISLSIHLLPGCATYIQLSILSTHEAGDHDVFICKVMATGVWDKENKSVMPNEGSAIPLDPTNALYTAQLREEGIL